MNKLNVFILEDDIFQRNIIKSILKKLEIGHIAEFGNGKEAYNFLKTTDIQFDVFILDLNVPGYDGLKFLEEAIKIVSVKNVLIVSSMQEDVLKSVDTYAESIKGINFSICQKPIVPMVFLTILDEIMREKAKTVFSGKTSSLTAKEFSEKEILDGIEKEEFFPLYQPQINLLTGKTTGLEALARWKNKIYGTVPPYKFIPLIEQSDNETKKAFTFLMLKKVANDIISLRKLGYNDIKVALNIFLSILELEDFCDKFASIVKEFDIEKNIVIEVTESGISSAKATLSYSLSRLRIKGIEISLDDFGTGYASLLQLASLPFTEIKVDRSFVKNINEDEKNSKIVKMSKLLAEELGLRIIAEGCENEKEVAKLVDLGIGIAQGYYFSKPVGFEKMVNFISVN